MNTKTLQQNTLNTRNNSTKHTDPSQ